ncbi:MAG TPA: HAD family hydrolase, partial [Actinomycetota bacterium]|nr:HAD family hydrolase [Actinomycetota bacterium]
MTLADGYDAFLLDLDGVLYRGDEPIPGAAQAVAELRRIGPVVFLTNNSARTPGEVAEKLAGMGVEASADEVVTSARSVAPLVRDRVGEGSIAFVVGGSGLRVALEEAGVKIADPEA